MFIKQFLVEGLGHASYLIASDRTREAAVVDPRRDVDVYLQEARSQGLRIRYVLETHNHNDFLSGARQLANRVGAEQVASAEAHLQFPYRSVREGDELPLGELLVKVLFTPGHTPEHFTYVVVDTSRADVPVLAFTGGDLLVGSVGRPDLLGRELGEKLGAVHVSLDRVPAEMAYLDREAPTVVLCGTGYRSSVATSLLRRDGFRDVANVLGGMEAWYAAGYPTAKDPGQDHPAEGDEVGGRSPGEPGRLAA